MMVTERTEDETILRAALTVVFGPEWLALSAEDQALIVRDCTEEGGVQDFRQYQRHIGVGNLASYAQVMRVRFSKE
jgi:hypothetical protein